MHYFVTGASGWVGSRVARNLIASGNTVTSLARSDAAADKLQAAGIQVLRGGITDFPLLTQTAKSSDGVVHCAFNHDFSKYVESLATERAVIDTFGAALAGSNKPLVITSAMLGVKPEGAAEAVETDLGEASDYSRAGLERYVVNWADKGVRAMALRLPAIVHGKGDYGFVDMLIKAAKEKGSSCYLGAGDNKWPAVHVDDVARLYVLALEKGKPGARYHAVGDRGVKISDLATVIGNGLGIPVESTDDASHLGFLSNLIGVDAPSSGDWTAKELGWQPRETALLEDVAANYF